MRILRNSMKQHDFLWLNMVLMVIHIKILWQSLHIFLIPHIKTLQQTFDRILLWIVWSVGRVHSVRHFGCPVCRRGSGWFFRCPISLASLNQRNRFMPRFKMLLCRCDCSYFEDEPAIQSCDSRQKYASLRYHSQPHSPGQQLSGNPIDIFFLRIR